MILVSLGIVMGGMVIGLVVVCLAWEAGRAYQRGLGASSSIQPCDDLVPFADGELNPDERTMYREHLSRCRKCRADLLLHLQMTARLSSTNEGDV
jgi:hypothetical protein